MNETREDMVKDGKLTELEAWLLEQAESEARIAEMREFSKRMA
jgi:hypothetical protein